MTAQKKVLITCPPMLGMLESFSALFEELGWVVTAPDVVQTLGEEELIDLVPEHDGWIIGDDPATGAVLQVGADARLRAAVKWGIGIDNVDLDACHNLGIAVTNTPGMFGAEVADVAMGYVIALARETFAIDRGVRQGRWSKPRGISLANRMAAVIGYGDIGRHLAKRLLAADMRAIIYDPAAEFAECSPAMQLGLWPTRIEEADFIIASCALTNSSREMINEETLAMAKEGVRIVNVARGPVIVEAALERALQSGRVHSAALDVYEQEPLPLGSYLREHPRCILGSHNASNTTDAVMRASMAAIEALEGFLSEN